VLNAAVVAARAVAALAVAVAVAVVDSVAAAVLAVAVVSGAKGPSSFGSIIHGAGCPKSSSRFGFFGASRYRRTFAAMLV